MHIRSKSYYGLINNLPKNDERIPDFKKMWKEKGFEPTETWNLNSTLCRWIIPRLEYFIEVNYGFPANIEFEEWKVILNKMLNAFKLIVEYDCWDWTEEQDKEIQEGLDLFRQYFFNLWR